MFKIEIKTGGAAFRDEDDNLDQFGHEVCRLVRNVLYELEYGDKTSGNLIDINGNRVGSWKYE